MVIARLKHDSQSFGCGCALNLQMLLLILILMAASYDFFILAGSKWREPI